MKKDTIIQSKLNTLADGVTPDMRLLCRARAFVRDNAGKKHIRWRRLVFASASCLVVLAIVLGALAFGQQLRGSLNETTSPAITLTYSLSTLKQEAGTAFQATSCTDLLTGAENTALTRCILYKDKSTSKTLVISCEYVSVTGHGTDKLTIIKDVGGGLTDYKNYQGTKRITNENGVSVSYLEEYKNGEYYSYAYFQSNNSDYYMMIGSPKQEAGNYYFKFL